MHWVASDFTFYSTCTLCIRSPVGDNWLQIKKQLTRVWNKIKLKKLSAFRLFFSVAGTSVILLSWKPKKGRMWNCQNFGILIDLLVLIIFILWRGTVGSIFKRELFVAMSNQYIKIAPPINQHHFYHQYTKFAGELKSQCVWTPEIRRVNRDLHKWLQKTDIRIVPFDSEGTLWMNSWIFILMFKNCKSWQINI